MTEAKARPILFSGEMVKAILAGRKHMTRRVVKPQPTKQGVVLHDGYAIGTAWVRRLRGNRHAYYAWPAFRVGQRAWVRETWRPWSDPELYDVVQYRADMSIRKPEGLSEREGFWFSDECDLVTQQQLVDIETPWKPSIFMPRWASRLTLEVLSVRVERLWDITEEDAKAEGAAYRISEGGDLAGAFEHVETPISYRAHFESLWDDINGRRPGCAWEDNPFVFAISFRRVNQ